VLANNIAVTPKNLCDNGVCLYVGVEHMAASMHLAKHTLNIGLLEHVPSLTTKAKRCRHEKHKMSSGWKLWLSSLLLVKMHGMEKGLGGMRSALGIKGVALGP
jgi:hypothetical protein